MRHDPGVQHQQAGAVLAEHVPGERFADGVGGDRDETVPQLVAGGAQFRLIAGDADHLGARGGEGGGDGVPEPAAGSGDDGGLDVSGHRTLLAGKG
jgi:hypothetical protein